MQKLALIFLGSGLGGVCRYALGSWTQSLTHSRFPFGTLTVNLLGCIAIGFLTGAFAGRWPMREEYRLALVTGVLGGFTTFSAFGLETFALVSDGHWVRAITNIMLSIGVGLLCVWGGYRLGHAE